MTAQKSKQSQEDSNIIITVILCYYLCCMSYLIMHGPLPLITCALTRVMLFRCSLTYRFEGHLTHWGRGKMAAISQTTLSNAFSWMKVLQFRLKFHWSLFLRMQLTKFQHWFRFWLGAGQATSHYLNQWWLDYRRICASLRLNELSDIYLGEYGYCRHMFDPGATFLQITIIRKHQFNEDEGHDCNN